MSDWFWKYCFVTLHGWCTLHGWVYRQYLSAQIGFGNIVLLHYVVGPIVNTHLHIYSHDGNGWSVESQCSHTCSYDGNGWSVESQCSHLVS